MKYYEMDVTLSEDGLFNLLYKIYNLDKETQHKIREEFENILDKHNKHKKSE